MAECDECGFDKAVCQGEHSPRGDRAAGRAVGVNGQEVRSIYNGLMLEVEKLRHMAGTFGTDEHGFRAMADRISQLAEHVWVLKDG